MLKCLKNADWKKTGIFAAGVAFGTAGIKALSSNDAKEILHKCYCSSTSCKRVRYADGNESSGKCR